MDFARRGKGRWASSSSVALMSAMGPFLITCANPVSNQEIASYCAEHALLLIRYVLEPTTSGFLRNPLVDGAVLR
jgi:hypothetical protein